MKITREELYEAVWKTPTTQLAKTFGISDVALAKICKKLHVPKPGMGHWTRKEFGYRPKRTPLRRADCPTSVEITPTTTRPQRKRPHRHDDSAIMARIKESGIVVGANLELAMPAIRSFQPLLLKEGVGRTARLGSSHGHELEACLVVAPNSLERALLILDALQRLFTMLGYPLVIKVRSQENRWHKGLHIFAKIDRWQIGLQITERVLRHYSEAEPHYLQSATYEPTGKLRVKVLAGEGVQVRTLWQDGQFTRLEDQVHDVLQGAFAAAHALEQTELAREERQRQWEVDRPRREREAIEEQQRAAERQRDAEARERQRRIESARAERLVKAAKLWMESREISAFVAACEARLAATTTLEADTAAVRWLIWAKEHARSLDPLQGDFLTEQVQAL